jgi:lipid-binding SYLF domain-containing protein
MRKAAVFVVSIFMSYPAVGANQSREQKRLEACGQVFKEIMDIPDGIPKDLLNKAECVIVIPSVLKFAIGIRGDFGRGAITCRTGQHLTGHWAAPALFALEGAHIGLQLGGQATDFVLLVMNLKARTQS